ncbi:MULTISPECIES: pilin N-terminal domain-containing protein [Lacticaseibacillus]|jgi:hypothetical protein|uniref:pilin N-terminal domain-containing protein n=1 Tax=Lacticaseibacillus TaxID=2759736 RepID=UPI00019C99E5|nr:pilin N-terminal domain-containing protein [Lacticaseibacillus paracasei]EEI68455.1 LPXTG-motif cell wall anchor domain protein [Lacticaseibacillus paracasei subsp. paracasei ATCC 25302 = DSM 5622 = JCM 8130]MCU6430737.1 pilin N-terminal domain-containing protein [Lacticaseibacillus paracasei]TDG86597.1 hypothetical protein C5L26_000732 [Lacticaseibacillus paracasei subsp. paracasei]BAN72713.1 hypothetical protein LBPC_2417 [Lacticaseibacillus paracasei subsp. paracasei]GEL30382.1 hypotheti
MQLSKQSVVSALLICGVALSMGSSATVFASTDTGVAAASSSSVVNSDASETGSDEANVITQDSESNADSSKAEAVTTTKVPLTPAKAEQAVKQVIEIHQVTPIEGAADKGLASTLNAGVNGSTWKVYDVTPRFDELVKAQKADTIDTDAMAQIQLTLSAEAGKADGYQIVTSGVTKTVNGEPGVLDVQVTVPAHSYKAYTFVNTSAPSRVDQAASFTLILPVADDDGNFPTKQVIEPKSGVTPKPVTTTKLQQTGHTLNEGTTAAGMSLAALGAIGAGVVVKKRKAE